MAQSSVILSGFADEAAHPCDQSQKAADRQFAVFAALGLQYYSIRFIDVDGGGSKNAMKLTKAEIKELKKMHAEYGLGVSSIGSPIGKVKLLDVEDGTKNAYIPFDKYLKNDVKKACDLANAFESKLLRGFSFLSSQGNRRERAYRPIGRSARPNRRTVRCRGPHLRAGSRAESGRRKRLSSRGNPQKGQPPGAGHHF